MDTIWLTMIVQGITIILLLLIFIRQKSSRQSNIGDVIRTELQTHRKEMNESGSQLRQELARSQTGVSSLLVKTIGALGQSQAKQLEGVENRVKTLSASNEARFDKLRETVENQLNSIREENERKLEEMRKTVDERLQSTLEKRLGESFKLVGERLEAVHKGLGEMQTLATGVGDLKRVLSNVKIRGTWGEYRVEALLEQLFSPEQYDRNVETKVGSGKRVEFAIKLPAQGAESDEPTWLPIDSKFPQEDYQRLVDASEEANDVGVREAKNALKNALVAAAKNIREKYINPPNTTDFAIMFLPTEGLYAEVLRYPGLHDDLQNTYRVVPVGPTTFSAVLNSLNMGFRTLAIQKRSSEVWQILAAVKTEFGKFGDVLARVKRQLDTASSTIDQTAVRTRAMERKLRDVEQLPEADSAAILSLPSVNKDEEECGED